MPKFELSTKNYPAMLKNLDTWETYPLTNKLERLLAETIIENDKKLDKLEDKINTLTQLVIKHEKHFKNRPSTQVQECRPSNEPASDDLCE